MSQSRRVSMAESVTQAAIGLPVGLVVAFAVALLGLSAAVTAGLITVVMFLVSILRGYVLRRIFNRGYGQPKSRVIVTSSDFDAHEDAMEPLGSHNWEPPPFNRKR